MIVAERKAKVTISEMHHFGEAMTDGCLTVPSNQKIYNMRAAILQSKRLGRPLTEEEMKTFEV